jgi:integrase
VVPGLTLRVTAAGARTWVLVYRVGGRVGTTRRYSLGRLLRRAGLGKVRAAAREVLARVMLGQDPQLERNAQRRDERKHAGALTVAGLVERYLEAATLAASTAREWRRQWAREIRGTPIGASPAATTSRGQFREWGRRYAARSSSARQAHELLRTAYSWGVRQELVPASPFVGLESPVARRLSARVLSPTELRALLRGLRRLAGPFVDAVELLLLTLARRSMVMGMRVDELDLTARQWVVQPRTGLKRRAKDEEPKPHVVPLSPRAVAILSRRLEALPARATHVFAQSTRPRRGQRRKSGSTWWSSAFTAELRVAMAEEYTGQAVDREDAGAVKAAIAAVPRWTIHNLRHTASTLMREVLGVGPEVVDLLLAHVRTGVRAIYDRSELLPERRAALVAWAAWLDQLEASEPAGAAKVLPMQTSARRGSSPGQSRESR